LTIISDIYIADDITILLSDSTRGLQVIVDVIGEAAGVFGLALSSKKTTSDDHHTIYDVIVGQNLIARLYVYYVPSTTREQ